MFQEVTTAIHGAITLANLSIVLCSGAPRRQDWQTPHTPCKVTGCRGSVLACFILTLWPTTVVLAPVPTKLLVMAGTDDWYTSVTGCFAKNTFNAIFKAYSYLTPDLWKETVHQASLSGIHRPSHKDSHQSLRAQDPGSSCGHQTVFSHKKNKMSQLNLKGKYHLWQHLKN